jgi:predicted transcriptional regulator
MRRDIHKSIITYISANGRAYSRELYSNLNTGLTLQAIQYHLGYMVKHGLLISSLELSASNTFMNRRYYYLPNAVIPTSNSPYFSKREIVAFLQVCKALDLGQVSSVSRSPSFSSLRTKFQNMSGGFE